MHGGKDSDDLYRALLPSANAGATREDGPRQPSARIAAVDPHSPAERAGLVACESIVAADGVVLRDIIDWRWVADGARVSLIMRDALDQERSVVLERNAGEGWGIEFERLVFDGVRTCRNSCSFCFIDQLPKGLRRSLYVRDDDFRLSFLQGNFITLTNLDAEDLERIDEQHLSPLYVSLHSVDETVRKKLIGCAHDDALERFDQLVELGIDLHVQLVLVPGMNDASRLDQTLTWLAMRDGVRSVGVVPVGYTRYQDRFSRSYENQRDAVAVLDQLEPWREACRRRYGISWVHAADEFYLNGRQPLPAAGTYDGFPQYENGIGLVRTFVDDVVGLEEELTGAMSAWLEAARSLPPAARFITLLTGELFAPVLESLVQDGGYQDALRVLPVPNRLFGGNVSVAGLLSESDVSAAVRKEGAQGVYLVPDVLGGPDGLTLDDVRMEDLGPLSGSDVRVVSSDARGLIDGIKNVAQCPPSDGNRDR